MFKPRYYHDVGGWCDDAVHQQKPCSRVESRFLRQLHNNFNIMTAIVPTMTMVALLESKAARRYYVLPIHRLDWVAIDIILSHDVGDDRSSPTTCCTKRCTHKIRAEWNPGHRSVDLYGNHNAMRGRHRYYSLLYTDETSSKMKALPSASSSPSSCTADVSGVDWWMLFPAAYASGSFIRYYDETLIHCTLLIMSNRSAKMEKLMTGGQKVSKRDVYTISANLVWGGGRVTTTTYYAIARRKWWCTVKNVWTERTIDCRM